MHSPPCFTNHCRQIYSNLDMKNFIHKQVFVLLFFLITSWDQFWVTSQYVQYQWQEMFHKGPISRTKDHYWTGNECFGWAGPEENSINYTLAHQLRAVRGYLCKWLPIPLGSEWWGLFGFINDSQSPAPKLQTALQTYS